MRATKEPLHSLLPPGCTSENTMLVKISKKGNLVPNLTQFAKKLPESSTKVFVISASGNESSGEMTSQMQQNLGLGCHNTSFKAYDEHIAISNYDLSSIVTCSKVCFTFEELWGVL